MTLWKPETAPTRDIESRLACRRSAEALHLRHKRTSEHNDAFVLRHDRIAAVILRASLQLMGVYSRGCQNALNPIVRHLRFQFQDLPPGLDGFRILHLADLHIDGMNGLAEVVADLLAPLEVDLCVMTGDYRFHIDGPCDEVYPRMRMILSSVRARSGVIGILGNHDTSEMAVEFERYGVRVLINESFEAVKGTAGLWVAGVDDPHYYGCDDLAGALENIPPGTFTVLLAHTPELFEQAASAGINLYLCGHTHAGQIRLPWIGAPLLNADCPRALAQGHWRQAGMQGYTSAGVGSSMLPVRFNCAPEILVIELTRKTSRNQGAR